MRSITQSCSRLKAKERTKRSHVTRILSTNMELEASEENIFHTMLSGAQLITTVLVIKPNAVRSHLGKLLKKLVQEKFHIVALCHEVLSEIYARKIIPLEEREVTQCPCGVYHSIWCQQRKLVQYSGPYILRPPI